MLIGYARVSTGEQILAFQRTALEAAGCERIFGDRGMSGTTLKRPALEEALASLGQSDVLAVWTLDRLGRSLPHLLQLVERLNGRGPASARLPRQWTPPPPGASSSSMSWEPWRSLSARLSSSAPAPACGPPASRVGGQDPSLSSPLLQLAHARELVEGDDPQPPGKVARLFSIDRSTLWRALKRGY